MADGVGVRIFTADIIYHLFDNFLKHRKCAPRQSTDRQTDRQTDRRMEGEGGGGAK